MKWLYIWKYANTHVLLNQARKSHSHEATIQSDHERSVQEDMNIVQTFYDGIREHGDDVQQFAEDLIVAVGGRQFLPDALFAIKSNSLADAGDILRTVVRKTGQPYSPWILFVVKVIILNL